ncbi:MAG: uroporphyrinogen decarboxylase [Alphaproteobacteria bacterium]|nr:uroporphyrinogen decarboxylase [Alphaproteobacteria bacterium]
MTQQPVTKKQDQPQPLKRVLSGQAATPAPFWLMRQAGRYLPEYRALRERAGGFLDLCFNPEWAAEVTLQPLRRFDMDAAILFSDILVIPHALGQKLWFAPGEGPRLELLGDTQAFSGLGYDAFDEKLSPVYETVRRVRAELPAHKSLIGFAGAPWTVACYMIEGRGGGVFQAAQDFAKQNPDDFQNLMDILVAATARYLTAQVKAGADVLQIFDSWAGLLPPEEFERWVIAPTKALMDILRRDCPATPVIGFPRGVGEACGKYAAATGVNGMGLGQEISITRAREICGDAICLQGNLAPELLLQGGVQMEEAVMDILDEAAGKPFIFNLGHGIIKETPPEHVARLAAIIRGHKP